MSRFIAGVLFVLCAVAFSAGNAHALDRRVARPAGVLLKTSGIGVGAGLLVGAASAAFFDASFRTMLKCTSIGLYGGLGFGLFVLLAPPEMIYGTPEDEPVRQRDEGESAALPAHYKPVAAAWAPLLTTRF